MVLSPVAQYSCHYTTMITRELTCYKSVTSKPNQYQNTLVNYADALIQNGHLGRAFCCSIKGLKKYRLANLMQEHGTTASFDAKISWKRNFYILKFVCNLEKMIRNIAPILILKWYMGTVVKGDLISEGMLTLVLLSTKSAIIQ